MSEDLKLFESPVDEEKKDTAPTVKVVEPTSSKLEATDGKAIGEDFSWSKGVSKENQETAFQFSKADDLINAYNTEKHKSKELISGYKGGTGKEYNDWINTVHGKNLDYSVHAEDKDFVEAYKTLGIHPHVAKGVKDTFSELFKAEQVKEQTELQAKGSVECKALADSDAKFNDNLGAVMNSMDLTTDQFKKALGSSLVNKELMTGLNKIGADLRSETLNKIAKGMPVDNLPDDVELLEAMYQKEDEKRLQKGLSFVDLKKIETRVSEIYKKMEARYKVMDDIAHTRGSVY